jgi:hypothetical protein
VEREVKAHRVNGPLAHFPEQVLDRVESRVTAHLLLSVDDERDRS